MAHPWAALDAAGLTDQTVVDLRLPPAQSTSGLTGAASSGSHARANRLRELRRAAGQAKHMATACGHRNALLLPDPADPLPGEWIVHLARVTPVGVLRPDMAALATALNRPRNQVLRELWGTDPADLAQLLRAQHAVLVEGPTDRTVFSVLLRRWGLGHCTVVTAHSKVRLAALRALAEQLGVRTYVIFDGDGGALPPHAAKAHRVLRTRQVQTAALTATLPCPSEQASWGCGDPGVVGPHWAAWQENLETELQTWPTFLAALREQDADLSAKDPAALGAAVERASLTDLPESFRQMLERLRVSEQRM
ncbi:MULTISPECIES: TOPRIM nucleotidyl transferase/hydrolase domain-containing protein [Kocuria]|uniref:OLD protein-like TOPRIM domain-containing protein n=1 Tax=Kocuria subflava TaxID=1736139 RepID=A0A846TN97_9MICC|nr:MULTISPECIES: TOPRIM nucleotidyl transferase/hydrolase domain-containing protein [Kocuria]NKE08420.1 hypothetical protein [Kocuria subflava]